MVKVEEDVRRGDSGPRFYSQTRVSVCRSVRLCNLTQTMPFDKNLHNLLEQPFGPYLEETILTDKCKFMASKRLLLEDFQLAYNNKPTG